MYYPMCCCFILHCKRVSLLNEVKYDLQGSKLVDRDKNSYFHRMCVYLPLHRTKTPTKNCRSVFLTNWTMNKTTKQLKRAGWEKIGHRIQNQEKAVEEEDLPRFHRTQTRDICLFMVYLLTFSTAKLYNLSRYEKGNCEDRFFRFILLLLYFWEASQGREQNRKVRVGA